MDSCGPFPVLTPHKKNSFWVILNDKSNFGHIELLSAKSDVYSAYLKLESLWEAKSGNHIVAVHMDDAKEFSQGKLSDHLTTLEDGFQMLLADSGLPTVTLQKFCTTQKILYLSQVLGTSYHINMIIYKYYIYIFKMNMRSGSHALLHVGKNKKMRF